MIDTQSPTNLENILIVNLNHSHHQLMLFERLYRTTFTVSGIIKTKKVGKKKLLKKIYLKYKHRDGAVNFTLNMIKSVERIWLDDYKKNMITIHLQLEAFANSTDEIIYEQPEEDLIEMKKGDILHLKIDKNIENLQEDDLIKVSKKENQNFGEICFAWVDD